MSKEKSRHPRLERLSWVASIFSLIFGVFVWLAPSPIDLTSLATLRSTRAMWTIIRLAFVAILVVFEMALFLFKVNRSKNQSTVDRVRMETPRVIAVPPSNWSDAW